ncbi:MAG: cytochrome b/b6 domain-containing protein [Gallionella sp.]
MIRRILVWDMPTRAFHWLQVLSFGTAYLTAFSERLRNYHVALGYILLGLLVFRLLWGFIGTRYARFSSFLFNPKEIVTYLLTMVKGRPVHYLGHNPAGSVSVWLLFALGLFICVTGVMALQDDASDLVVDLHGIATDVMLGVILLHLIGVLISSILHRENLVRSMFTGYKSAESDESIQRSYNWLGVLMVIAVVVFWFAYVKRPLG